MKSIKVFYHGKRLRDIYPHARWYQVIAWKTMKIVRKVVIWSLIVSAIGGASLVYAKVTLVPTTLPAPAPEVIEVPVDGPIPVLERIADCESGVRDKKTGYAIKGTATQFDENGQVLIKPNSNGTVDIGYMQINTVNFALATKLGFDLTKESDNKSFGTYLYKNRGSEPWGASRSCWNR